MSRNSAGDEAGLVMFFGGVAIMALIVWKFSTLFGLDFATGATVLGRLLLWTLTVAAAWWLSRQTEAFGLGLLLPVAVALLWLCGFPALDYWASQEYPSFYQPEDASVWYDAWYTKLGGIVAPLAAGVGISAWRNRRY